MARTRPTAWKKAQLASQASSTSSSQTQAMAPITNSTAISARKKTSKPSIPKPKKPKHVYQTERSHKYMKAAERLAKLQADPCFGGLVSVTEARCNVCSPEPPKKGEGPRDDQHLVLSLDNRSISDGNKVTGLYYLGNWHRHCGTQGHEMLEMKAYGKIHERKGKKVLVDSIAPVAVPVPRNKTTTPVALPPMPTEGEGWRIIRRRGEPL